MKKCRKIIILCVVADLIVLSGCKSVENNRRSVTSEAVVITNTIPTTDISISEPTTHSPDYIVNTSTGKFHYPDCPSVNLMSENNKLYFTGDKESLSEYGYYSCGRCNP
ncbi:MAG: hypothetical protein K2G36_00020 [Ruminococcus sp.]|nr:hypothetical protein [Ruminococcus sp.]